MPAEIRAHRFCFFLLNLLCSNDLFVYEKISEFKVRHVLKRQDLNALQSILRSKKLSDVLDASINNIELIFGRGLIEKAIRKVAKKNDMVFIAMSQPDESFRWLARDIATVTKPYSVKPKSAQNIIGGLIPADQKYSKIGADIKLLKHYQAITDSLIQDKKVKAVPVVFKNKIAVARRTFQGEELLWVPLDKMQARDTPIKVLANEHDEKYVSDVDGLLLASKTGPKSQWDQIINHDEYGLHAAGHISFANDVNNRLGKSVINHSFCHSWEGGDCEPSFPLTAYSPQGISIIERGPSHDPNRNLWAYLIEIDKKGYKIRPNCQWQLPAISKAVCHLFKDVSCNNMVHPCNS